MGRVKKGKQRATDDPPAFSHLEEVVEVTEEDDDNFGALGQYLNLVTYNRFL